MKHRLAKIFSLLPFAIYGILLAFTLSPLSAKENNRISVKNLYGKFAYAEYYPIDSQYNESIKNRLDFLSRFDDLSKQPPWKDNISGDITDLSNYFVTSDGDDFITLFFHALQKAEELKEPLKIETL